MTPRHWLHISSVEDMCSCQDCQGKRCDRAIPCLGAIIAAAMRFILLRALLDPVRLGIVPFGASVLTRCIGRALEMHGAYGVAPGDSKWLHDRGTSDRDSLRRISRLFARFVRMTSGHEGYAFPQRNPRRPAAPRGPKCFIRYCPRLTASIIINIFQGRFMIAEAWRASRLG
jgi:hypothetical protein